jgi:hypothetical protein
VSTIASFGGWTVFALSVIWVICTNIALRQHYKDSDRPALPANATAMTQLIGVVVVAAVGCSPFHLLWVLPASYLTGFFALRSKIVGRGMALRLRGRLHHPVELVIGGGSHDLVVGGCYRRTVNGPNLQVILYSRGCNAAVKGRKAFRGALFQLGFPSPIWVSSAARFTAQSKIIF